MKPYILHLSDPQANLETVGGKGMSLAKLTNAGIPVPDGFHITTEAYRHFIDENKLQAGIQKVLEDVDIARPDTLEAASQYIQGLFADGQIPEALAETILSTYEALPGGLPAVAVRSSATAEDLPEASFAGQQDTYLNITGPQQVLKAVRKCWASLWTARAIGYRARQGIQAEGVALAVVVQLLVNAEAAGILFTANPISGARDEMLINASWGLGEAVVGGAVTPDSLTVDKRNGKVTKRETAKKLVMTVRTADGTEEQDIPAAMQQKPVLSDAQAAELTHISREIENLYGMPMDIEWAFSDKAFTILQARPITTIADAPLEWAPPNPKGFYIRASVVDLMPKPLSPLFISLWIPEQIRQMQPLGKKLIGSDPVLPSDYVTAINTYAYASSSFSAKGYWWMLTSLIPSYPKLLKNLIPVWRDDLYPDYQTFVAEKKSIQPTQLTVTQLWIESQRLVSAAAYYVCGLMFATMGASAGSEGLLTRVYDKLAKQEGDPEAAVLMMGWDNIPVRSEKSLYDIAAWVKDNAALSSFVQDNPTATLANRITAAGSPDGIDPAVWSSFTARFKAHMEEFGYIIFQLDFAEPLPLDHPEMMLKNIKMYLRGEGSNPHERQQASEKKRIETTAIMLKRLKGLKLWAFTKALNWGQKMSEVREDALSSIGLAFPKLRELLFELGGRFAAASIIEQANDIYWLEKDEISDYVSRLENKQAPDGLKEQVDERKAFNERVSKITPPTMMPIKKRVMGVKTDVYVAHSGNDESSNILKGEPTSVGKVTAPACVLHGPEDFDQMRPGDVIIASTTTPAWTPLFGMASAVVADIGGPLSHGSIVAREFGIPAVMGTGVATKRIQNGQMITVDGSAGTVEILSES